MRNLDEKLNKQQKLNKPKKQKQPINFRRIMIVAVFVLYIGVEVGVALKSAEVISGTITLNEILEKADNHEIESIGVTKDSDTMTVTMKNGEIYNAVNPSNDTFIYDIMRKGVDVTMQKSSLLTSVTQIFMILPLLLILAMFAAYLTNTIIGGSTKMFTILTKY